MNYIKKKIIIGILLVSAMLAGCETIDDTDKEDINQVEEISGIEKDKIAGNAMFAFSTKDIDGNTVSIDDFSDAKLIMVNFWEPWCGPCVGEMPDLEKIYEEYSADGLVILGIFSTTDMDDEVRKVLQSCGTTYPILRYNDDMEPFITDYVPTTIFMDQNGNILTSEPIVGGNSYDGWKQIIEVYINR